MEQKLCIYLCNSLLPEAEYLLGNGNYPDVCLKALPLNCNCGIVTFEKALDKVIKNSGAFSKSILITSSCSGNKNLSQDLPRNIEIIRLKQCFEIFASLPMIHYLIKEGSYLVTNGWLKNYKQHIRKWGFDDDSAKSFFGESIKNVLLLETGLPGNYLRDLAAVSAFMGLSYDVLPIGTSHLKLFVDSMVYKWQAEVERTALNDRIAIITRESADYSVLFLQLKRLIDLTDETLIVKEIANLLDVLFMPQEICFQSRQNEKIGDQICYKKAANPSLLRDDNTFVIDIAHRGEILGAYHISGVQFPQFMPQYASMKEVISQIGGLTIVNARKYAELVHAREYMAASAAELRELNATKDKFFSIIAHDLKGPFNSIIGLSEILAEQVSKNDYKSIEKYTKIILQSSTRALDLLMNLLDWSRTQTGRIAFSPDYVDFTDFIKTQMLFFYDMAAHKQITLKWQIAPDIIAFADIEMISTVMRNLVSNAIKFTREGGEIVVYAEDNLLELVVSISDNGVGISPERLDKLFKIDENDTTSGTANEKGTGLGLILCKEFVEKHQGRIWVESVEGNGSVFFFSLPVKSTL